MEHKCPCGNIYKYRQSLLRHQKECKPISIQETQPEFTQQIQPALNSDIIQLHLRIKELEMKLELELQKIKMECDYKLQLKDMECNAKIQEIENKYKSLTPISNISQCATIQNNSLIKCATVEDNKTRFCLKDYLNSLSPITIDVFKEQFKAKVEHYEILLSNTFDAGMSRNIINYINIYKREQLPIVITNSQYARFKIYIYKLNAETKTNTWHKYEAMGGTDELEKIIMVFACRLLKYKMSVYTSVQSESDDENQHEINISKNMKLTKDLSQAEDYKTKILNIVKEYFVPDKLKE